MVQGTQSVHSPASSAEVRSFRPWAEPRRGYRRLRRPGVGSACSDGSAPVGGPWSEQRWALLPVVGGPGLVQQRAGRLVRGYHDYAISTQRPTRPARRSPGPGANRPRTRSTALPAQDRAFSPGSAASYSASTASLYSAMNTPRPPQVTTVGCAGEVVDLDLARPTADSPA
jgi:hypothetical protein